MHLPLWARKPKHKKKVIPTRKGWVVESTGEVLVSHKNLDTKLVELFSETHELLSIEQELTDVVSDHDEYVIKVHLDDNNVQDDDGKESSNEEQNQSDDTEIENLTEESESTEDTETNDEEKTESSSDVVEETNDKKEESTEKPKKKRGRPPKKK